jgi:hypothetical protein
MNMENGSNNHPEHNEFNNQNPYIAGLNNPIETPPRQSEITPPFDQDGFDEISEPAAEAPAAPFGVARFAGTELHFEGKPPAEYVEAIWGEARQSDSPWERIYRNYELFADHITETTVTPDGQVQGNISQHVPLVYETETGSAAIDLRADQAEVTFTGVDGSSSYGRYHTTIEGTSPFDIYRVVRRDAVPLPRLEAASDTSHHTQGNQDMQRIRTQRAIDRKRWHEGSPDPIAGFDEMSYILKEVLPNAKPPAKTYADVRAVMRQAELYDQTPLVNDRGERVADPHTARDATDLFENIMIIHQRMSMRPENIMTTGASRIVTHLESTNTTSISVTTEANEDTRSMSGDQATTMTLARSELLGGDAAVLDEISFITMPTTMRCVYASTRFDRNGEQTIIARGDFVPTRKVIETLRNYLFVRDGVLEAVI